MIVRGLTIGINAYPSMPLHACVADAEGVAGALLKTFGFEVRETRLLDDSTATAANIRERTEWVLQADRWVIHQSGHGFQRPDDNGDEADRLDEGFCPVDFDWYDRKTMLLDDDYAALFSSRKPGSQGIFISDSCHSGDLLREGVTLMVPSRCMPAPPDIAEKIDAAWGRAVRPVRLRESLPDGITLLSACGATQTASDGSPFPGGPHGAFTGGLLHQWSLDPFGTFSDHIAAINRTLGEYGYGQVAEISGNGPDRMFRVTS